MSRPGYLVGAIAGLCMAVVIVAAFGQPTPRLSCERWLDAHAVEGVWKRKGTRLGVALLVRATPDSVLLVSDTTTAAALVRARKVVR